MNLGEGASLGSTALAAAEEGAIFVINGLTGTIANNIEFVILFAVIAATLIPVTLILRVIVAGMFDGETLWKNHAARHMMLTETEIRIITWESVKGDKREALKRRTGTSDFYK